MNLTRQSPAASSSLSPAGTWSRGAHAPARPGPRNAAGAPRPHRSSRLCVLAALVVLAAAPVRASLNLYAPGGMPSGRTVTAEQLWQEFDRVLPPGVWVSPLESQRYEVVSAEWLRRTFLPALRRQMLKIWEKDLPEENRAANCNGFALVCRTMLHLSAMNARAHGPAAATIIVRQDRPFGGLVATHEDHTVAFVLTDEGPWIIEAQSAAHVAVRDYPNLSTVKLVSVH